MGYLTQFVEIVQVEVLPRQRAKGLRRPIRFEVNGKSIRLFTIGHCARALGRTTTTLRSWERSNLFPPAPYRTARTRVRLYPEGFVKAMGQIVSEGYLGERMDRSHWQRFQTDVWSAHEEALKSLMTHSSGVLDSR